VFHNGRTIARTHRSRTAVARRRSSGRLLGLAAAALAVVLGGCQTPEATSTVDVPRSGNAELVLHISNQPFVTAEAAYRAVYLLAKGQPFAGEFDELAQTMKEEKLIGPWAYGPGRYVTRADVGFMVCRACGIRTGVNWNLTGLGRYAWRELIYHGIAEGGDENHLISGGEFVGLLLRAEQYLARRGQLESPSVELGPRPS